MKKIAVLFFTLVVMVNTAATVLGDKEPGPGWDPPPGWGGGSGPKSG